MSSQGQRHPAAGNFIYRKSPQNNGFNASTIQKDNPVESIRNLTSNIGDSLKRDVLQDGARSLASQLSQLFGVEKPQTNASGDIPKEGLQIDSLTPEAQEQELLRKKYLQEQKLREEDKKLVEKRTSELQHELEAIIAEIQKLAQSTSELSREVKIAAVQKPVQPGRYHIIFFRSILEFIVSFRKRIDDSALWLAEQNKRRAKKGFWAQVGRTGAKRLLSQEDYSVVRAAG